MRNLLNIIGNRVVTLFHIESKEKYWENYEGGREKKDRKEQWMAMLVYHKATLMLVI